MQITKLVLALLCAQAVIVPLQAIDSSCAGDVLDTLKALPLAQKLKALDISEADLATIAAGRAQNDARRAILQDLTKNRSSETTSPSLTDKIAEYASNPVIRSAVGSALGSLFGSRDNN